MLTDERDERENTADSIESSFIFRARAFDVKGLSPPPGKFLYMVRRCSEVINCRVHRIYTVCTRIQINIHGLLGKAMGP